MATYRARGSASGSASGACVPPAQQREGAAQSAAQPEHGLEREAALRCACAWYNTQSHFAGRYRMVRPHPVAPY